MGRRSVEEWRALFAAQERSGQPVMEFCQRRGVCLRSFWRKKKELDPVTAAAAPSPFVRVEKVPAKEASRVQTAEPRVLLRLGRCEWELLGMSEDGLLRLVKALA